MIHITGTGQAYANVIANIPYANRPDYRKAAGQLPSDSTAGADLMPIDPITEKQLARLWQRRAARSRALRTESGRRVQVLYPGRPGVTAGPDFRDALLLVEGEGLVQGDVEVHLRAGDWRNHGHHRDPNYNGVALHAALHPSKAPARTDSGAEPPLASLRALLDEAGGRDDGDDEVRNRLWGLLAGHGYRRPNTGEQMAALLNRAGDERFLWRSRQLGLLLAEQSPEQTLWEAIGEALGYRHNQHPFLRLATAAPVSILLAGARRLPAAERPAALGGWLLGMAGFGEGQLPYGLGPPLDAGEWRLFRVRPSNHPRRRVMGAGGLLARFADSGLAAGLEGAAAAGKPGMLTAAMTVTDPGGGAALIGAGRARDIAVNAALPFWHCRRARRGDAAGAAAMLDLYRSYGALAENEITRELATALQEPAWGRVAGNARRQQGLIHWQRLLAGGG